MPPSSADRLASHQRARLIDPAGTFAPDFVGRVVEVPEGGRLDVWVDAAGPDRVVLTEVE